MKYISLSLLISLLFFESHPKETKNFRFRQESNGNLKESTYDLIKKAISKKQSVTFYYDGYLRKASPHVLGTNSGREQALFMQYGGQSKSGLSADLKNNWRCFFLAKIENISINNDRFYTADDHSQRQNCVEVEDVVVDH